MSVVFDLAVIFILRAIDVGMATIRIVLLSRGRKGAAAGIGFFECLIWVVAVSRVLTGLDDPLRMIAFAAGFAAGTYVGSMVEEWLAIGQTLIRVVTSSEDPSVAPAIRAKGFGATVLNGDGRDGDVRVCFTVIPRKKVDELLAVINEVAPNASLTIEDTAAPDWRQRIERTVRR